MSYFANRDLLPVNCQSKSTRWLTRLIGYLCLSCLFLLPILLATSALANAQDLWAEQGMKSYGSFEGGNLDSINMQNLRPNIRIPLVDYPQRGGELDFAFYITYQNPIYEPQVTTCLPYKPYTCTVQYINSYSPQVRIVPAFSPIASLCQHCSQAVLIEPDGTTREMATLSSGNWVSVDATGYNYNPSTHVLTDRRGIRYSIITDANGYPLYVSKIEDTNGNLLTSTADPYGANQVWTDTLGRTITGSPPASGPTQYTPNVTSDFTGCTGTQPITTAVNWALPGYGGNKIYKVCYAKDGLQINSCGANCLGLHVQTTTIQSIVLPNGTAWTFNYDSGGYGGLTQIDLPTGGSISYSSYYLYSVCGGPYLYGHSTYSLALTSRSINANDGAGSHTTTYSQTGYAGVTLTTTSTDPLNNQTVHTIPTLVGTCSYYETQTQYYQGTASPGNLLKTVSTTYSYTNDPYNSSPGFQHAANVVPSAIVTSYPNGQQNETTKTYDSGIALSGNGIVAGSTAIYGDVLTQKDYDYGNGAPGSLLRTTTTNDLFQSNSLYLNNNLLDLPYTVVVYFDDGMLNTSADPCGNTATFAYSLTYWGALPTAVTNALDQIVANAYDFNTGLITSKTDPNNLPTTYTYDSMRRVYQVNYPDGGQDTFTHQETTFPFAATLTSKLNSSQNKVATTVFDGLGRVIQSQLASDPQGTVYENTTYDVLGRVATVSNPYRTGTDATSNPGTTTYGYDALNRKVSVTYPDNSVLKTAYCGAWTLVTDPTAKWRRSRVDGLGRLVEVDEPNALGASVSSNGCPGTGEPIWITSYTVDTFGNLTQVVQNGSHQRTFTYDSLSRLLTSVNPENSTSSNPVQYAYNPDSTLLSKTDARNITANYTWDALHRQIGISYSNGDPPLSFSYDQATCLGLSPCQNIGHRTSMTDGAGSESWAYQVDATNLRSIHQEQRTNNSSPSNITKTTTYYFDLAGNVTKLVYPTGRTVNYTYDSADRPSSAVDGANGITYVADWNTPPASTNCSAGSACYTPQGSIYSMSLGQTSTFTGLNLSVSFNNRLQPNEIKASSTAGNAIDITYNFVDPPSSGNAGVVNGITNNLNSARSQSFTYDQLNRIISAGTSSTSGTYCWGYQFSYDAWGNLLSQAGWTPNYNGCSEIVMAGVTADVDNHISGFSYDAAGNTLGDSNYSYTWDGESRLKTAGGVTYSYDGDGRRTAKVGTKLYWYGSGGEILAETTTSGSTQNEYVFFGGKRVAVLPAGGAVLYYAEDVLGSSRVIVQADGTLCYDADFTPFGGERAYTNTCSQNYKFEGKERDTETQNDDFGAREYTWRFGRWLSSDWSATPVPVPYANLSNPQTLNLYAMVTDDPESFSDLDGHDEKATTASNLPCGGAGNAPCAPAQQPPAPSQNPPAQNQVDPQQGQGAPTSRTTPAPSWDRSKPLPDDPSKLGPDWKKDPTHDPQGKSGDDRYINDKTGDKLDWHKGIPGKPGEMGKDHWHWVPGGKKDKEHYHPGDTIKKVAPAVGIGVAIGVAIRVILETAPEWAPAVVF